jgi:hypothetical protein
MDILQIALVFLIILLSIFLTITGIQVFFILRDLKKSLDKFNGILQSGEKVAQEVEKPIIQAAQTTTNVISTAATVVAGVEAGVKAVTDLGNLNSKPKAPQKPKFYKKILK